MMVTIVANQFKGLILIALLSFFFYDIYSKYVDDNLVIDVLIGL